MGQKSSLYQFPQEWMNLMTSTQWLGVAISWGGLLIDTRDLFCIYAVRERERERKGVVLYVCSCLIALLKEQEYSKCL